MCSPDEKWRPIQNPSNHRSEMTPPCTGPEILCITGVPNGVDLARVGRPGEVFPCGVVALADLESIQKVAGVLNQPRKEAVVDRQLFSTSLFKINEQRPRHFLYGLHCLFGLAIPFGVAPRGGSQHGSG